MNSYRWPALPVVIILIMTTCLSLLLLPLSVNGEASSSYQRCQVDTNCTLGEYVFDNEGQPISNQICIIDIRNPSGELIVNDAMMITTPDGWHSYTVNLPSPTGLYRALMYCNNAGDVGYLDKSFILGTTFEDIDSDIDDLGTTVGGIGSDVTDLGTSLSDIGSDVSDLGGAVSGIGLSLSDLDVSIADLGLTITGEEITDLTTLSHLITGIQTTVDSIETKIDQFTEIETKIDTLIAKWGELEAEDLYDQSLSIADEIEDLGTLEVSAPSAQLSGTDSADIKTIKNTVLSMKALIEINRNYLETLSNRPIVETWLEEGSIVFKTLITNPSPTADQMVAVDYYLPREVQQEHIQHIDDGLSSSYDTERDALRITGSFTLAPQETRTFTVEVDDIWTIDEQEVASLRKQARELAGPLEGTSYFSQGSLLTSDINASLDTVLGLVDETAAPQTRILNYRKAQIELSAVKEKIKALETLVVSAGSMNTMFGYIGGSQTYATWGIMVVLLGGFVFLTLYTRSLLKKEKSVKKEDLSIVTPPK